MSLIWRPLEEESPAWKRKDRHTEGWVADSKVKAEFQDRE